MHLCQSGEATYGPRHRANLLPDRVVRLADGQLGSGSKSSLGYRLCGVSRGVLLEI